jgi:hypothetical protein
VVAALVYATLAVVFAFTWDRMDDDESLAAEVYWCAAILIQPLTGFLIPRLWAFALPFVALVVSLPISEPAEVVWPTPITDAGVKFLGGIFAMILMSFGMACRLTIEAFRDPPEPARSTRA